MSHNMTPGKLSPLLLSLALLGALVVLPADVSAHICEASGDPGCDANNCSTPAGEIHVHVNTTDSDQCSSIPTSFPKPYCESSADTPTHVYSAPSTGSVIMLGLDGSIPPCPYGDTTWDGHYEWAVGGGWLQAAASICTDAYPDHTPGTLITVVDDVLSTLGSSVNFWVYSDTVSLTGDPCGDFESDYGLPCVDACTPGFPPGLDGSYQVFVSGSYGHIYN